MMNKAQISIRMPRSLLTQLNSYLEDAGLSRTEVIVRAIASYLSCEENISLHQRMTQVEQRLTDLEIALRKSNKN